MSASEFDGQHTDGKGAVLVLDDKSRAAGDSQDRQQAEHPGHSGAER